MPPKRERDYKREYEQYHGKPQHIKERTARNRARREMIKAGRLKPNDPRDVDHKDRNPLNNSLSNLRAQPVSVNRARNSHKT